MHRRVGFVTVVALVCSSFIMGAGIADAQTFSDGVDGTFDDTAFGAIGSTPRKCEGGDRWCSRCEDTATLWSDDSADPTWITFDQVFAQDNRPFDLEPSDGQPVTRSNGTTTNDNIYHYFEFTVTGGDGFSAQDVRRDSVFVSLVSPESLMVANGEVVVVSADAGKRPGYDFFVGYGCVPMEGRWNNQGYGNRNAIEQMKSIHVNVTQDGRYFIALQARKKRYDSAAGNDYTMKLSRGTLYAQSPDTRCTPFKYRYPNEIQAMVNDFVTTGILGETEGGAVPYCGETPAEKKYNIKYVYPPPPGGLSQREIAIVVGAVGGGVVLIALITGMVLWVRYKRTTQRMAKFSSLSRGLPDALLDGEGQEVAV